MSKEFPIDINASIIDQRVSGIIEKYPDLLPQGDINKKKSAAFVILCMSTLLDISIEEAAEFFTDGGNDAGVDGLSIGDVEDGTFLVTIFQGKYKTEDFRGIANFPENSVKDLLCTVSILFDPAKHIELNKSLAPKIEEIRSLVREYIPIVRVVLCNNGAKWNEHAQSLIEQSGLPNEQISWIHFNHNNIVEILRKTKSVDDSLSFTGQAIIEDFNFKKVLIGKVRVQEIAELFDRHGDLLLERNVRRYLGLHSNRVNAAIHDTLENEKKRSDFYFFNNGITIVCNNFGYNALQKGDYKVKLQSMQIINGGQTCKTIQETINLIPNGEWNDACVLVRVYALIDDEREFIKDITYATNSQNPVDLRDLHSNDELQQKLEIGMKELGYTYKRHREEGSGGSSSVITSSVVAEAVLAIWRKKPHQAKFLRKEHFGKLYKEIFSDLNAPQAVLAVVIFRTVENIRKNPSDDAPFEFTPYASHYIAMLISMHMLTALKMKFEEISHNNLMRLLEIFDSKKGLWYSLAERDIQNALNGLYGARKISLQQLSGTFRRGDLLEYFELIGVSV